jgi:hypothetical protein
MSVMDNTKYIPLDHGEPGEDCTDTVRSRQLRRVQTIQRAAIVAMAVILAVLLAVLMRTRLLWAMMPASIWSGVATRPDSRILKFAKDGSFQITVFNDLHFGEGEDNPPELGWGPISDVKTTGVMNTILDQESSQLVVLNGDLITGENTYYHNSTDYLDIIVEPIVRRDKLWASTYGNHDHQFNLSSARLLQKEREYPRNSLTTNMVADPEAGNSNYYLPVFGTAGDRNPVLILWFFDSMGGSPYLGKTPTDGRHGLEGVVHNSVRMSRFMNETNILDYTMVSQDTTRTQKEIRGCCSIIGFCAHPGVCHGWVPGDRSGQEQTARSQRRRSIIASRRMERHVHRLGHSVHGSLDGV